MVNSRCNESMYGERAELSLVEKFCLKILVFASSWALLFCSNRDRE